VPDMAGGVRAAGKGKYDAGWRVPGRLGYMEIAIEDAEGYRICGRAGPGDRSEVRVVQEAEDCFEQLYREGGHE
jgi:hypothetical protein